MSQTQAAPATGKQRIKRRPFNLKLFVGKVYLFKFINSFTLIYAVYALMFKDFGISDMHISVLFMTWSAATVSLMIPCGILADRYNRKRLLMFGQFTKVLTFLTWMMFPNFYGFIVGFLFWGVQSAIIVSTFEPFVYDELKRAEKENLYAKVCGKAAGFDFIACALVLPLGTLSLGIGYPAICFTSAVTIGLSILLLSTMKYTKRKTKSGDITSFKILFKGIKQIMESPKLIYFMVMLAVIVGGVYIDKYYGLIAMEMGIPKRYVGMVTGSILIMQSFGSWTAYMFEGWKDKGIYAVSIIGGLIFGSVMIFYSYTGLFLLGVSYIFFSVARTLCLARVQHLTDSDSRATVLSIYGFMEQTAMLGGYGVVMAALSLGGYRYAFGLLGGVLILVTCFMAYRLRHQKDTVIKVPEHGAPTDPLLYKQPYAD